MHLVLASTSPRRHDLLALLGVRFDICDPGMVERIGQRMDPVKQGLAFAEQKARACAERRPASLIIGSDTLIAVDGRLLGKPADLDEARAMLHALRGRAHDVYTALVLFHTPSESLETAVEQVRVWMRDFSDEELADYLRSGESLGKAGAYSIQGRGGDLISRIEGDFPAVVGLPLRLLASLLERRGLHPPVDVEALYRTRPYPNWDRFGSRTT
jgi:septum formation protein